MSELEGINLYEVEKAVLQRARERQPAALRVLRTAIEEAQGRMQIAHEKGITPGITSAFTGQRIPLSYEKHPKGAYELLLWLATITHACIIVPEGVLSRTPIFTDPDILRELMRFIASDPGVSIKPPFPYDQRAMRRAFEEWNTAGH